MCNCRYCGQPLRQQQQGTKPAKVNGQIVFTETITLVDCTNRACPLWMVTREQASYCTMDLEPYLGKQP